MSIYDNTTPEQQDQYERDHSERANTCIRATAVANAAWRMGIALGGSAVAPQTAYFKIKEHAVRMLCETNQWIPGDLTEYQRKFIEELLESETSRYLASALLVSRGELDGTHLTEWMNAYRSMKARVEEKLPRYERSPVERARMLEMVIDNAASEFELEIIPRAKKDAGVLDDAQRQLAHEHLANARKCIAVLESILADST